MTEKLSVKWLKTRQSTASQIYNSGLAYCFVSEDMRQCHPFVFCKDFLQDVVQSCLHEKEVAVYGFTYKADPPITMAATRIAITNVSDKGFDDRIPAMLDFINQFAGRLHLKPTTARKVDNAKNVYITDGSSRWMNSPPLLSMYALLLRAGGAHTAGRDCMETINGLIDGTIPCYQREDAVQLRASRPGIEKILKIGYRPFFYIDSARNYPKDINISTLHNSSGIVNFSSGMTSSVCNYWHRKSLTKRLDQPSTMKA